MTQQKCAYITVIIHTALFKKLLKFLHDLGVNHLYSTFGRTAILSEPRGLSSLFKSSDLASTPIETLYFYLPLELEEQTLKAIVKLCRLDIPGRGSIFSKHVSYAGHDLQELICHLNTEILEEQKKELTEVDLFKGLTQISCVISKGLINEIARLLLHLGVVPTITNASGTGLRDQLGVLRITIPKQKELLTIIVGNQEASSIMDKMITWGKLNRPGRGFIWQSVVQKGVINFKTSEKSAGQAASTEQIIAAIDSLKGDFSWRQGIAGLSTQTRRDYFKGIELIIQVTQGDSLSISRSMIKLGISGATVQSLKTLSDNNQEEEKIIVPQEIIRVVVSDKQYKRVSDLLNQKEVAEHFELLRASHIFSLKVPRAFSYRLPN